MIFFNRRQYTLGELAGASEQNRMQKASACGVQLVGTYHTIEKESIKDKFKNLFKFTGAKKINTYYITFNFQVTSDNGTKHHVYIKCLPDFQGHYGGNNPIQIYCDCSDFKFRAAYDLDSKGSLLKTSKTVASLAGAIGQKPKTPGPIMCKHCIAALQCLMNNYNQLMRGL